MGMMMMTATALRKSRGLIQLMGQYEIRFADDDDNGDGNGEDKNGSEVMVMMTMVTALRKSRGLVQLVVDGLMTLMENDDG